MLDKVKLALRISHDLLDSAITDAINEARAEMIRSGVSADVAGSNTYDLTCSCIKTYCLYSFADNEATAMRYFESFQYQLDNLRKSTITLPEEEDDSVDDTEEEAYEEV